MAYSELFGFTFEDESEAATDHFDAEMREAIERNEASIDADNRVIPIPDEYEPRHAIEPARQDEFDWQDEYVNEDHPYDWHGEHRAEDPWKRELL